MPGRTPRLACAHRACGEDRLLGPGAGEGARVWGVHTTLTPDRATCQTLPEREKSWLLP